MDYSDINLQTSKYLRIVPTATDFALYHTLFGGLCITDQDTVRLIECFKRPASVQEVFAGKNYSPANIQTFFDFLLPRSLLVPPDTDEYEVIEKASAEREAGLSQGKALHIIQLIVTNNCNFHCKYCFTRSIYSYKERLAAEQDPLNRVMSPEQAQQYIEAVIRGMRTAHEEPPDPFLMIQFFGGEPLLNMKTISSVLSHFGDGREFGVDIQYSIVTNGSLLDAEIIDLFLRHNVTILLSFDSPRGRDRVTANGTNSNETVMHKLKLVKDSGVRVAFNSVLSRQTFDYFGTDLIDCACEYNIPEIGVILDLDPAFYTENTPDAISEKLLEFSRYGKKCGVVVTGYWHQIFQHMLGFRQSERTGFKTCSALGCQFSIEPNGAVFACKGSSGYFGHVLDMPTLFASENWRKYSMRAFRNSPVCENCDIENFCSGFCLGPLEKKYHDICVMEKETCAVYKKLIQGLIHDIRKYEIDTLCML